MLFVPGKLSLLQPHLICKHDTHCHLRWVDTPLLAGVSDALKDEIQAAVVDRVGQVEEIADAIRLLSSPMSSYIYGIGLVVDGGYSL